MTIISTFSLWIDFTLQSFALSLHPSSIHLSFHIYLSTVYYIAPVSLQHSFALSFSLPVFALSLRSASSTQLITFSSFSSLSFTRVPQMLLCGCWSNLLTTQLASSPPGRLPFFFYLLLFTLSLCTISSQCTLYHELVQLLCGRSRTWAVSLSPLNVIEINWRRQYAPR